MELQPASRQRCHRSDDTQEAFLCFTRAGARDAGPLSPKSQIEYARFACLRSQTTPPRFALAPADSELCPRGDGGRECTYARANERDRWTEGKRSVCDCASVNRKPRLCNQCGFSARACPPPRWIDWAFGHSPSQSSASQPRSSPETDCKTQCLVSAPCKIYIASDSNNSVSAFVACQKDALETKFVRPSPRRKMSGRTAFV